MAGERTGPARRGKKSDEGGAVVAPAEVVLPVVDAEVLPEKALVARLSRFDARDRLAALAVYSEDDLALLDKAVKASPLGEVRNDIEERAVTIRRDLAARAKVAREEERDEGLIFRGEKMLRLPMAPDVAIRARHVFLLQEDELADKEREMVARHKDEKEAINDAKADLAARRKDVAQGFERRLAEVDERVIGGELVVYLRETGEEVSRRRASEEEVDKARQRKLFPGGGW
jgi:hypothetical protein